jgi:magnesium chelatase family protein
LLDRIDLHVEAPSLPLSEMQRTDAGETSATVRERIVAARAKQATRFSGAKIRHAPCNARMSHAEIRTHCAIDKAQAELLSQAMEQLSLSARAYDRILKVARTIADLAGTDGIEMPHLLEAIQYRSLDRALFY